MSAIPKQKRPSVESVSPPETRSVLDVTPAKIRKANKRQLMSLQKVARLGSTWGVLELAPELQGGRIESPLRLLRGLPKNVKAGSREADFYVTEMMRAAISMTLIPSLFGRPLKFSTTRHALAIAQRLIARQPFSMKGGRMWRNLVIDSTLSAAITAAVRRFTYYHRIGCLPDGPAGLPRVEGSEGPRDRSGEPEHTSTPVLVSQIQPYSDEFISEAGWAAMTMIETVGPTLLDAVEAALKVKPRTMTVKGPKRKIKNMREVIAATRDPIIRSWDWRSPDGTKLTSVPLTFHIKRGFSAQAATWPPRTMEHALRMVQILQGAHMVPIGLATGNRHGELLSMEYGSLSRPRGGPDTAKFRTWKQQGPGGRVSDAPVPSLACKAILQQERMAKIFRSHHGLTGKRIWISIRKPKAIPSLPNALNYFVDSLGLRRHLSRGGANHHRFRKTLARLAALALVHAPKVLMDAFGHRDEQMTILRYILSDPSTLREVQEIVREMIILKGVEAIEKADVIQGTGSDKLRTRVELFARRLGQSSLEPSSIAEFARAMTEDGTSWAIVAPGIVCTSFKTGGLCNKGRGKPDPHYCDPACDNQLVFPEGSGAMSRAVVDAIETVDYVLGQLKIATKENDAMLVAQYRGQIRSLLNRWREVDAHYASSRSFKRLVPGVVLIA